MKAIDEVTARLLCPIMSSLMERQKKGQIIKHKKKQNTQTAKNYFLNSSFISAPENKTLGFHLVLQLLLFCQKNVHFIFSHHKLMDSIHLFKHRLSMNAVWKCCTKSNRHHYYYNVYSNETRLSELFAKWLIQETGRVFYGDFLKVIRVLSTLK